MRLRLRRDCSLSVEVELGFIFFFLRAKLYFGLAVIEMVNPGVFLCALFVQIWRKI